jgi:hypothetical protein
MVMLLNIFLKEMLDRPVSCRKQLRGSLIFILGGPTIVSSLGLAVAMQALGITASTWLPASLAQAALQLLQLAILNDFGLYWGE